jgi:ketosteroid isomerase-like protein
MSWTNGAPRPAIWSQFEKISGENASYERTGGDMAMTHPVSRSVAESFYQAYDSRDPQRIGGFLDDHVEWDVFGPAAVMQVCGQWRGKAAVMDRFASVVPRIIEFIRLDRECLLVDGDRAAMNGRVTGRHCESGRIISHRVAHFIQFRDGKVISFRAINDTLDAAEQFLGHAIDLGAVAGDADLVMV